MMPLWTIATFPLANGKVAIVHNGIIENHAALRRKMEAKGHVFSSETDSEVLAHLFKDAFDRGLSPRDAGTDVIARIQGTFGFAAANPKVP